jgi:hypothetical protein
MFRESTTLSLQGHLHILSQYITQLSIYLSIIVETFLHQFKMESITVVRISRVKHANVHTGLAWYLSCVLNVFPTMAAKYRQLHHGIVKY